MHRPAGAATYRAVSGGHAICARSRVGGIVDVSCWLVVVQREQRDLYAFLRERLQGVAGVEVVPTRDRRTRAVVAEVERRGKDRRRLPPVRDRGLWTGLGFLLVREEPPRGGESREKEHAFGSRRA